MEDSVDASTRRLEDYIKKRKDRFYKWLETVEAA